MIHDPRWREKIFFAGLLLLLAPPIGWPAALGYRKALVARLHRGQHPILPDWKGQVWRHFREGLKAVGVIFSYFLPLYVILGVLVYASGGIPDRYPLYTLLFFPLVPLFSPLAFPFVVIYLGFFGHPPLGIPTTATLLLLFALATFAIPAGFLLVSKSGRMLSAFRLNEALSLIRRKFRPYLHAWYHSIVMSLSGHFAIPFSPWGIVWCYLGIIFLFNSILFAGDGELSSDGNWFKKLACEHQISVTQTARQRIVRVVAAPDDGPLDQMFTARIDQILVPIPSMISSRLFPGKP